MLTVDQGDVVEGTISVRPNAKNHRDLDIDITYQLEGDLPAQGALSYKMCVHLVSLGSRADDLFAGHDFCLKRRSGTLHCIFCIRSTFFRGPALSELRLADRL